MALETYILSDSQAHALLDLALGNAAYAPPATWYVALVTSHPAQDGSGYSEPAGGSYGRVAKTNNAANFPAAAGREKSNGTQIQFPVASAAWGTVIGVALFEANSGGSAKFYAPLNVPETVAINNQPTFEIGQLKFRFIANS